VRRLSAGDYAARTGLTGFSEMARLGAAVDEMAAALERRQSERTALQDDLRRSRDEAAQASLSKSRFLAAASHDLRQPLQSLSMTVALLEMRHRSDADASVIARLNRALSNLAELLNALLDISQLEAGLAKPAFRSFSVAGILTDVAEEYATVAQAKGLRFNVEICDSGVRSDPGMLGRMLRNLVENAIRFTPAGGIIDVFCRDRGSELLLIVRDSGIGIAEDKREESFRTFQRYQDPERDRSQGLGLGLAIAERMGRLLGHVLAFEAVPGEGCAYSIALAKADPVPATTVEQIARVSVDGRVLLVEDDELVLATTAQLLEELGATVVKARSAEDALKRLEAEAFDLIIADYRLPASSGVELIHHARQRQPGLTAAIITGDPSIEELKRLVDLDTEVIQKPVRADRLRRLFSKVAHA
jgi:signal transduction histidine kinase